MQTRLTPARDLLLGLCIALGAAVLINLPLWEALLFTDEARWQDVVSESSDEEFYLARIREVADGHPWVGHPYVPDRSDQRYPLGNLWETTTGTVMRLFALDIKTVSILMDAIFPFLLVLLFWRATRPLLPDWRWRMMLVGILFLGKELLLWKRPISPQATMILPLLYLWALLSPARAGLRLTAVRGALIGLMTLSYPFHWTYCLATEGLCTIRFLAHDPAMTARLRRLGALLLPLAIAALPWILLTLSVRGDPAYGETLARLGLLSRRLPTAFPLQGLLLAAGAFVLWQRRTTPDKSLPDTLLLLLGGGLVVLNQPLLTGKEAEFSSHYRQILFFPLWMSTVWAIHTLLAQRRRWAMLVPTVAAIVLLILTATTILHGRAVLAEARTDVAARTALSREMDALQDLPREQVVLTDRIIARHMSVYTSHYPFFAFSTHMYLMPNAEIAARAAVQFAAVPDEPISPRMVVGSSYLNAALHARTLCRLMMLFQSNANCDLPAEGFLPEGWDAWKGTPPTEDLLRALSDAHVTYVFLRDVPAWLRPSLTLIHTVGDYELLYVNGSRP